MTIDGNGQATFGAGVDDELLAQRKAFLRPDSALVAVLVTDEDDSSADPMAIGGQGWAFAARNFPGSDVLRSGNEGTTAPRGTSACATDPGSAACTTCAFATALTVNDPSCKAGTYHAAEDDDLNVRFHRMKERFGVDPQYPISRYVDGFTRAGAPDRAHEHPSTTASGGRRSIEEYVGSPSCTNPIFAATLPANASEELCNLPRGPRSRDELVVFAVLGGLPPELATDAPDWTKILGANPDAYDQTGIDPHMIQSVSPRPGLAAPSASGNNGPDPVHGREWDTRKQDLQYACTFALPSPRTCEVNDPSCDCTPESTLAPPVCGSPGEQLRAKAYPTPRPLRVAKGLGNRGVIGSICATSYDGTMQSLADRVANRLAK